MRVFCLTLFVLFVPQVVCLFETFSSECGCKNELQTFARQLQSVQDAVTNVTANVTSMQGLIDTLVKKQSALLTQISQLNRTLHSPKAIVFTAQLAKDTGILGPNQYVVFDHVVTNNGGGYDVQTGTFVAPVTGTYIFYVSITNFNQTDASVQLVKNGHHLLTITSSASVTFHNAVNPETNTHVVTVGLHAGDHVGVQNAGKFDSNERLLASPLTSFSGQLISPVF
ncbi:heavy metal-binding protein HIP-like [Dreissena polymorpha]|uniref:C1q domain-containing protein n=1 Tax=Dreissena polymorpha TaxID=45954 RepID=A0A9D4I4A9_DREPO|nr:heavy metal-binding protein HIP-like [Dreissena polymorpha]KAH3747685.1 hypothetical protein DPMN_182114 [Dreissena polymorpha]